MTRGAVSVIGSTGSIGRSALRVIKRLGLKTDYLAAYSNLDLLKAQVEEFQPRFVGVIDESRYDEAKALFGPEVICGLDALTFLPPFADTSVIAVTGVNGLYALLETLRKGRRAALANKESLVAGGELVNRANRVSGGEIIPVDSEHSALFQCLKSGRGVEVKRLILTASGGAFYNLDGQALDKITPKDITHPTWKMGRKITLDSCTMMNKALEIVEAYHLFGVENIDYAIHPDSIIHSMAEFCDGSVIAQLSQPDMEFPIQYALTYPSRTSSVPDNSVSLSFDKPLRFLPQNPLFNAPELGLYAAKRGGGAGTVLNAANEAAATLFEEGKIGFPDIVRLVEKCLSDDNIPHPQNIRDIIDLHNSVVKRVRMDYNALLK